MHVCEMQVSKRQLLVSCFEFDVIPSQTLDNSISSRRGLLGQVGGATANKMPKHKKNGKVWVTLTQ